MSVRRLLVALTLLAVASSVPGGARAGEAILRMFPVPGTATASPQTQISFRGDAPDRIGSVAVSGSLTGVHAGTLLAHSDGRGATFRPDVSFQAGEAVVVATSRAIAGGNGTSAQFTIAVPVAHDPGHVQTVREDGSGSRTYRSRPGVPVPAISVRVASRDAGSGDFLLTPSFGPTGSGPLITDYKGNVIWFKPLPDGVSAANFRVQTYRGQPVLTWWEGSLDRGQGFGEHVIVNAAYREIARVRASNGYRADMHDFVLRNDGTAFVIAYNWLWWDLSAAGRPVIGPTVDAVIEQIDVATGLVLFEWHSLDHVGVDESSLPVPMDQVYDYFHINSLEVEPDATLLVSGRHTSAIYRIDMTTGEVLWRLGGSKSDFSVPAEAHFSYQHDARLRPDGTISLFDNGAGPLPDEDVSSGRVLRLDLTRKTAASVKRLIHPDRLLSTSQGNVQRLASGGYVIGWGGNSFVTEFDRNGKIDFNAATGPWTSYRAFRQPWNGHPTTPPNIAVERSGSNVGVYVSWNGDTRVRTWELLAGITPTSLKPVQRTTRTGFETILRVKASVKNFRVRAYDARGKLLKSSGLIKI